MSTSSGKTREHVVGVAQEDVDRARASPQPEVRTGKQFLRNTTVSALIPEQRRRLLTCASGDSVAAAWKTLADEKISSLPVEEVTQKRGCGYDAFIDVLDLVNHIVGQFSKEELTADNFQKSVDAAKATAREVCGKFSTFSPVEESQPLLMAAQTMVKDRTHRLPVLDGAGALTTIVTQSALVDLIAKNAGKFKVFNKTVGKLKLGLKDVFSVKEGDAAVDAFRLIYEKGVSGVAVTDEAGALRGNISASDLREIGYDGSSVESLFLTAGEFVARVAEQVSADRPNPGPVAVTTAATVEEVVTKFHEFRTHRVYVVDGEKTVGVISLVDVIAAVVDSVE